MDCKPDVTVINQENQDSVFCFDFCVKVENDIEWPIQTALAPIEKYQNKVIYEEFGRNNSQTDWAINNLAPKENYYDQISYASNENYQENINFKQFKLNFQTNDVISDRSTQAPHEKYQDKIIYEELKKQSSQTCMLCGQYFSDSYSLLRHNLTHLKVPLIKRKVFMCGHCSKYYSNKTNLKNHIVINHVRKYNRRIPIMKQRHECLICNKTYSYRTWYDHMKAVHSETKSRCKECNLLFKCERYLKRHYKYAHEGGKSMPKVKKTKTKCPKCPAILFSNTLPQHLRNCHSTETYTCHLCNSKLKCKAYLKGHMKRVHYNDGMIHECDICGKEFKSKMYVKVHIKNSHNKKKL